MMRNIYICTSFSHLCIVVHACCMCSKVYRYTDVCTMSPWQHVSLFWTFSEGEYNSSSNQTVRNWVTVKLHICNFDCRMLARKIVVTTYQNEFWTRSNWYIIQKEQIWKLTGRVEIFHVHVDSYINHLKLLGSLLYSQNVILFSKLLLDYQCLQNVINLKLPK